ncbi:hypothetical protein SLA2020_078460 [Shorea laevis]
MNKYVNKWADPVFFLNFGLVQEQGFTIPNGDGSQEFHGVRDEIPSPHRFSYRCLEDPFSSQEPLQNAVFRLCDALTECIFHFFEKDAVADLFNHKCPKLEGRYQSKMKNTVLSKFQDSTEWVILESSGFFRPFPYEVCY